MSISENINENAKLRAEVDRLKRVAWGVVNNAAVLS
jgi:hypothetical protein